MILSDLIILYIKIVILFNVKNSKMVQDEATDTVQWKTDRKLYTTYRLMPHSTTLNDPNPAFKGVPLSDYSTLTTYIAYLQWNTNRNLHSS